MPNFWNKPKYTSKFFMTFVESHTIALPATDEKCFQIYREIKRRSSRKITKFTTGIKTYFL